MRETATAFLTMIFTLVVCFSCREAQHFCVHTSNSFNVATGERVTLHQILHCPSVLCGGNFKMLEIVVLVVSGFICLMRRQFGRSSTWKSVYDCTLAREVIPDLSSLPGIIALNLHGNLCLCHICPQDRNTSWTHSLICTVLILSRVIVSCLPHIIDN